MRTPLVLASIFLFVSLTMAASTRETADQNFEALAKKYIAQLLEMNPEFSTELGDHRFDNRLNDYSVAQVERTRAMDQEYLRMLNEIPLARLSKVNSVDYRIMRTQLEYDLFSIDTLREHEWNALNYNFANGVYALIARDFAPLKTRLLSVKERLKQIPAAAKQAKANLKNPPRIFTETAIQQNQGAVSLIRDDLQQFIDQIPELKEELTPAQAQAIAALEDYGKVAGAGVASEVEWGFSHR